MLRNFGEARGCFGGEDELILKVRKVPLAVKWYLFYLEVVVGSNYIPIYCNALSMV